MDITIIIAIVILIIVIALVVKYVMAIDKASEKIWYGSGDPLSMSQMLLTSLQANAQILFGILTLFILFALMKEKIVSGEAGLPIFSALAAYLLGKSFRESSFFSKDRKDNEKEK